jgi:YebC/PmpR family DNA-binding regulatory protein
MQKAKSANMPADNIARAIKKGTGEIEGARFEEVVYEGYAAGGIALVVTALTDNKNRAASEIRHIFTKHNSSFAGQGSVSRGFQRKGQIFVDASSVDEDRLMGVVLEAGAEDMRRDGDQFEILTDPSSFSEVTQALEDAEIATLSAEVSLVPAAYIPVADKSVASSVLKFVAELEDNDEVQGVYTNMDVDDGVLKELEAES